MAILNSRPWTAGAAFVSHGVRIGIRSNQEGALQQLEASLPPGCKPTRSSTVDRIYSLWIDGGHGLGGEAGCHRLYAGSVELARTSACEELPDRLAADLELFVAEWAPDRVFVHAGVVGWRDRAIILPGRSFSGKTSLVIELTRAGASYYSDEYAVLDARGHVHPYARRLSIRSPEGRGSRRCSAADLGATVGTAPLPVGLVLVTRYCPGARWRGRSLTASQGALALLANTVSARRRPAVALSVLPRVVSHAKLLTGVRGDAAFMVDELLRDLDEG